ncbi:MAG: hypothetical protein IPJ81_03810 [Chitinophagaceae bacterium]|nr:hypothetical protein [Chitinophagaceae bacterium]
MFYIIHILYVDFLYNEDNLYGKNLCSALLKRLLGNDYKSYIKYLYKHEIIGINKRYKPGKFSKEYWLIDEFISQPQWHTITDFTLCKKLKRKSANTKQYSYLIKWYDCLEMDIPSANEFAEQIYELKKNNSCLRDKVRKYDKEKNKRYLVDKDPSRQFFRSNYNIECFKKRDFRFTVDDKGNRFHSPLSKCNKHLRNFATCKGKSLMCIDMSNCQLFFLLFLLDKSTWQKNTNSESIKLISKQILSNKSISQMCTKISEIDTSKGFEQELKRYKEIVSEGRFYKLMLDKYNEEFPTKYITIEDIKLYTIISLFSKKGTRCEGIKTIFRKEFPLIYSIITEINKDDHSTLALLLQRIESHIFLDRVCKRISIEKPNLPIYPIHDSIASIDSEENLEYIKRIIKEECSSLIDVAPNLKVEYWQPVNNQNIVKKMLDELFDEICEGNKVHFHIAA